MRALVTGGAGFVGRHLCHALLQAGWDVTCVDPIVPRTGGIHPTRWPLFDPLKNPRFRFLELDCRSYFTSDDGPFDCAFHLAAMVGGRMMIEHDPLAVAEDLSIDAEFFRYCVSARPKKIIFFSSSAAYPIHLQTHRDYRLLKEDMITFAEGLGMPDLSYGWAKLTGEYLARLAHEKYQLDVICYRPFSGYGEDQDLSYPFPSICQRAYQNKGANTLKVWGTGDQMRDFIHITDCISFVLSSMNSFSDGSAINLSTGRLTSFKEFAMIAAATCGYAPNIVGTSDKPEGVFARGGDRTLQDSLGLAPTITFEAGVERGVQYFSSRAAA